jgi:hypothetical protein
MLAALRFRRGAGIVHARITTRILEAACLNSAIATI